MCSSTGLTDRVDIIAARVYCGGRWGARAEHFQGEQQLRVDTEDLAEMAVEGLWAAIKR